MRGLRCDLEAPYFACFRKPISTSIIQTYNIPPFTTIRGLLANCLGLPRFPNYEDAQAHEAQRFLQDELRIGLAPINLTNITSNKTVELVKILKQIKRATLQRPRLWAFPSSPMFREFLVNPIYRCFFVGNEKTIERIKVKLRNPERYLYLGQSDDMVNVDNIKVFNTIETRSSEIWSIIEGVYKGCEVVKIPYKFREDGRYLFYKTVSIPFDFPLELDEEVYCYPTDNGCICAY